MPEYDCDLTSHREKLDTKEKNVIKLQPDLAVERAHYSRSMNNE